MVMGARLSVWKVGAIVCALGVMGTAGVGNCALEDSIRVGLTYGRPALRSVTISGEGEWRARQFNEEFDGEVKVTAGRGELVLEARGRRGGVGPWIEFEGAEEGRPLGVDGRRYRGMLRIEVGEGRGLKVVNTVGLEDYVRGVVPNEMFEHEEAFKVQAVVSRTYGMYVRDIEKKHAADGFDICTTGHCQVYRGAGSERELSDEAVRATRGEVVTHRGRVIFAAYHANSGGRTQAVDEAWPGSVRRDFPYLSPVVSPYDVAATDLRGYEWCYRWERRVRGKDIEDRLRARGKRVGQVRALLVKRRTETGRVRELEVVGTRGRGRLGTPGEVRAVLGTPSAHLEVVRGGTFFDLRGWGRGHGVGMSQHGALGMAKAGYSYVDILGHFYTDVSLAEDCGRGRARKLARPELKMECAEVPAVAVPEGRS